MKADRFNNFGYNKGLRKFANKTETMLLKLKHVYGNMRFPKRKQVTLLKNNDLF